MLCDRRGSACLRPARSESRTRATSCSRTCSTRAPSPPPPLPLSPHRERAEPTVPRGMHAHRCVGAFIWWAWGYGTAYHTADGDGNPFIGLPGKAHGSVGWVLKDESKSGADFVSWWFQCEPRPCLHSACTLSPMRSHNPTLLPLPQPFPPASRRVRRHRGHHRLWSDGRARAARCGPGRANPTLPNQTRTHTSPPHLLETDILKRTQYNAQLQ